MSKERELLKRVQDTLRDLYWDIETELDKPEQEPDYYLWHNEVHEEHPTNVGDPDVFPLYLSPQKREPIDAVSGVTIAKIEVE